MRRISTERLRILILLALTVGALVSSLGALLWGNQDWGGLALNLGSELAGALVTYGLLELFIGRSELKAHLIAQMGSQVQDVAIAAAEELRRHGWLYDGSLRGANLYNANLRGASLLFNANLQGSVLAEAKLQRANLYNANLQGSVLTVANLQGSILAAANLQGAGLGWANLEGAYLDIDTTLPDGTKWTPDTDMMRFTDPDHPDFWQRDA